MSFVCATGLCVALAPAAFAGDDLSPQEIEEVVAEHRPEIRKCYERHAKRSGKALRELVVRFTVSTEGDVTQVKVVEEKDKPKKLVRCVSRNIKTWTFPAPKSPTEVEYPFLFHYYAAKRR